MTDLDHPDQVIRRAEVLDVALWYPRIDGHVKTIEIDLVDVRAAGSVRVTYDFDRNGWVISGPVFDPADKEVELEWAEVAFLSADGVERSSP